MLGHVQAGISPEAIGLLDLAVDIPMIGAGASLHVPEHSYRALSRTRSCLPQGVSVGSELDYRAEKRRDA